MRVTGIIAEYNPFHNGHLYQIEKTRQITQCNFIIAAMSGHFTQRGLPAIVDKYTRTKMALLSGVDLVIELPVPFATASAERFSEAGVSLLHKTGVVDCLSFGSECGDIHLLNLLAHTLLNEPPEVSLHIQTLLNEGVSYPRARMHALSHFLNDTSYESVMHSPNNILGTEYIKALLKYKSAITPLTIPRKTAHYHDTTIYTHLASASAIRKQIALGCEQKIQETMPKLSYDLLIKTLEKVPSSNDLSSLLHYKLIFSTLEDLYTLWDIPPNLCRSIKNAHKQFYHFSEITSAVTSKTYSRATVQRALLRILLSIKTPFMSELEAIDWIPFIRVLGCKRASLHLLSHLSKASKVPLITNLGKQYKQLDSLSQTLIDYEERATSLYYCLQKQPSKYKEDFTQSFIIL